LLRLESGTEMDNAIAFLKKKGPLGMPMAFWAGFGAIVLYLGYRWYKNRGSSSSSSSADTTGDTTGADSTGADTTGGAQPSSIDTTVPPDSTTPAPGELIVTPSTGPGLTLPTDPQTGHKKKPKPKQHPATHHDKKQGSPHTKKRRLPVRKSRNHHAPKKPPKKHSHVKAHQTKNIPSNLHPNTTGGAGKIYGGPPSKLPVQKHTPFPVHAPTQSPVAKEPPRKRRRG
jgi:hypothetical protein